MTHYPKKLLYKLNFCDEVSDPISGCTPDSLTPFPNIAVGETVDLNGRVCTVVEVFHTVDIGDVEVSWKTSVKLSGYHCAMD